MAATFGTTNISLNSVRAVLGESTKSLWNLCHNLNINRWAKYSPLTNWGKYIPFKTTANSNMWNLTAWVYDEYNVTEARLGDFRNYEHSARTPATIGFPEKLYKNAVNKFSTGLIAESTYSISFNDVYNTTDKYFGVAIRKVGDSNYSWCTNLTAGSNTVDLDINNVASFAVGNSVEVVLFYSSASKTITGGNISSNFYSLQYDATVVTKKTYTIESQSSQPNIDSVSYNINPITGIWTTNKVSFNSISVAIKAKSTSSYRWRVRITTPDKKYYVDYSMTADVTVNAGATVTILNTNAISLNFWDNYNMVFVLFIDLKNNNTLIQEISVMGAIEQ